MSIRGTLAAEVASHLRSMPFERWRALPYWYPTDVATSDDLLVLSELPTTDAVELLALASCSRDGHLRESALRLLGRVDHPRSMEAILRRLSDWVPQVREVAGALVRAAIREGRAEELLVHHRAIAHLRRVGRLDGSTIADDLDTYLDSDGARPALERALRASDASLRLAALQRIARQKPSDDSPLLLGSVDRDVRVRAWVAAETARRVDRRSPELLAQLLSSRNPSVALPVLRSLSPTEVQRYESSVSVLVESESRRLREAARFQLRRACGTDPANEYRERLRHCDPASVQPGWVACVGDVATIDDRTLLEQYVTDVRPRVRLAAIEGLARIDDDRSTPFLLAALRDESASLRKAAGRALRQRLSVTVSESLWEMLRSDSAHAARSAFRVLVADRGWDTVPPILHALVHGEPNLRNDAWLALRDHRRLNAAAGWIHPTPLCRARLASLFGQIATIPAPPPEVRRAWNYLRRAIESECGPTVS